MKLLFLVLLPVISLASTSPAKRSGLLFYQGLEAKKSHQSLERACGSETAPWKVFCQEGWYFQSYLFYWGKQQTLPSLWAWPPFSKPIEALSAGMALAFLKLPVPMSYLQLEPIYSALVVDGWAFMDKLIAHTENRDLASCWDGPQFALRQYCEFGKGRARFFVRDSSSVDDGGHMADLGLEFARAFHRLNVKDKRLQSVARGITDPKSVSPELQRCLIQRHQSDCLEIK